MDISLPASEGPTAAGYSGGASSRAVDSGKFSQTLSQEMSERPREESVSGKSSATPEQTAQTRHQATAASSKHGDNAEQAESDNGSPEPNTDSGDEASPETTLQTGKGSKKVASESTDPMAGSPGNNPAPEVPAEQRSILDSLKLLPGNSETSPTQTSGKKVIPPALDRATSPAGNSVVADGATNPALLRSNVIHNEIFNSLRTQSADAPATEAGSYADSLVSGKSLHGSGKNLPTAGKSEKTANADKQLNSFLPAGTQDWKYTADSLLTTGGDKSAKFEAFTLQIDSQVAESFSLVNAGTGKSLLTPQAGLKSELASPASAYTSLTSEFLAGSERWCQDFGTKIEWLNSESITKAELSLHPAELGVLDITINTEDDRISINIVTHNEKSREMLETSLPRLTELLKSQGLVLENSNISHNSSPDKHNAQAQANPFNLTAAEEQHAAELGNVRSALIRHQGQIDHYV